MCTDLSISLEKSTAGIDIWGLVCANGVNCMGKPSSWSINKAFLNPCDQYLCSFISGSICEPSPSVKCTVAVALRFASTSTSLNLDISERGKRFLNSEISWALHGPCNALFCLRTVYTGHLSICLFCGMFALYIC